MPSNHPITVHAWADCNLPNINPLIRIDHAVTPESAANVAIPKLRAKPPGLKAIQHWRTFLIDVPTNRDIFTIENNIDAYVAALRAGPDITIPLKWTREFYHRLKFAGITPDWIVCDEELGWSYWGTAVLNHQPNRAAFEKIYADPMIRAKMTPQLLALSPRDFDSSAHRYHRAVFEYSNWSSKIMLDALRAVVVAPATEIFGTTPPASNFDDSIMTFPLYDLNGWERSNASGHLSNWSSPALYLVPGNRHDFGRKKHPCWNRFIDNLNAVRSCIAGNIAPWIPNPSFSGDGTQAHRHPLSMRWLWAEQLRHTHATGAGIFLFWNPEDVRTPNAIADNQFASQLFTDLSARPTSKHLLPEIPLDADQVISNNYITTYSEFEKNFPVE